MSTAATEPKLAISIEEAARRIGVCGRTVREMIADKRLRASRIVGRGGKRGRIVIRVSSLEKLLDKNPAVQS
jgi:excisionase family DNA binding protein